MQVFAVKGKFLEYEHEISFNSITSEKATVLNNVNFWMIIGTLSHWYSFESAEQQLKKEYQCDRVSMIIQRFRNVLLSSKSPWAVRGLRPWLMRSTNQFSYSQKRRIITLAVI